jgi:hypothetical protein
MSDTGNEAQTRLIAEQVAEAAIVKFNQAHPELQETHIPPPIKWAGGILAAVMTAGVIGMAAWLVTSVSDMQVTLARIDERMVGQDTRYDDLDERVRKLESYHSRRTAE